MTQDEDIGAEAQLLRTAQALARKHAATVDQIVKRDDLANIDGMKLIAEAAKAGRGIGALLADGRKLLADLDALNTAATAPIKTKTAVLGSVAVKGASNEEIEMDDDSGRTPERMGEIHADIRRRLDAARTARESKQMVGRGGVPADRALPSGLETKGGASASPV
ncbi:hypothetical protein [Caulobacter sp. BK020]|uniref:hypothetical protein n=1 Tax=Caulobacter sp. BK020 TaxID=2512117 RepID=UPI001FB40652|nr:hypothetical protein [Caulobacter sp. BK020]